MSLDHSTMANWRGAHIQYRGTLKKTSHVHGNFYLQLKKKKKKIFFKDKKRVKLTHFFFGGGGIQNHAQDTYRLQRHTMPKCERILPELSKVAK